MLPMKVLSMKNPKIFIHNYLTRLYVIITQHVTITNDV